MQIFEHITSLQKFLDSCRKDSQKITLVPTMGGLHDGHMCLIDRAKELSDVVVVSIYVNPTQFSASEDFETYPKTLSQDKAFIKSKRIDALFIPRNSEIYPEGMLSDYDVGKLGQILCGISRPSHFNGVAQVVNRLLDIVKPNYSVFGQKDYQQLLIIKSLVESKDLDTIVESVPTIREDDGLAMSTRNKYLSEDARAYASLFYHQLVKAKKAIEAGVAIELARQQALSSLSDQFEVEYVEVLDANNLTQIKTNTEEIIIISSVRLGETRLIDNILFRSSNV
jgi:pantoate--beta-alanine ligase